MHFRASASRLNVAYAQAPGEDTLKHKKKKRWARNRKMNEAIRAEEGSLPRFANREPARRLKCIWPEKKRPFQKYAHLKGY